MAKSRLDNLTKLVVLIATILGIPIALFTLYDKVSEKTVRTGKLDIIQHNKLESSNIDSIGISNKSDNDRSVTPLEPNEVEINKTKKTTIRSKQSDLIISRLTSPGRLKPLDGYPVLKDSNGYPIFAGGFRAFFTFSHNTQGKHPIIITELKLNLISFSTLQVSDYSYQVDAESIIGAGSAKVGVFSISLNGNIVGRASKVSNGNALIAKSENFFDTDQPERITLKPQNDAPEEVEITVTAWENGLYDVSFTISYFVAGEDRQYSTKPIKIYYWEE